MSDSQGNCWLHSSYTEIQKHKNVNNYPWDLEMQVLQALKAN